MSIGTSKSYEVTKTNSKSPILAHGLKVENITFNDRKNFIVQKQQLMIQNKRASSKSMAEDLEIMGCK